MINPSATYFVQYENYTGMVSGQTLMDIIRNSKLVQADFYIELIDA